MKARHGTIIVTDSVSTNTTWWDQLSVSESSVVLTAVSEVGPSVVLAVATLDSQDEAQDWFTIISGAVNHSVHSVDVRRQVSPREEEPPS